MTKRGSMRGVVEAQRGFAVTSVTSQVNQAGLLVPAELAIQLRVWQGYAGLEALGLPGKL
jgi:hypothetical protein